MYNSWGPGKYDARFNFDGQNDPAVIPPAYGLAGVNSVTFTGDGDSPAYWNRYVAVTQMHGHGSFSEPRLGISVSNTNGTPDLVEAKLPALEAYQLSLTAPPPPAGSFDAAAAERGRSVFEGPGACATCHTGATFTDANTRLHDPSEVPTDPTHARAQRDQDVPDHAAPRGLAASAVLSRRQRGHPGGRGGALQRGEGPRLDRGAEGRPGRVPEEPLGTGRS